MDLIPKKDLELNEQIWLHGLDVNTIQIWMWIQIQHA